MMNTQRTYRKAAAGSSAPPRRVFGVLAARDHEKTRTLSPWARLDRGAHPKVLAALWGARF